MIILLLIIIIKGIYIEKGPHVDNSEIISLYDFLFNPKWGFALAFWGEEKWKCPESCIKRNGGGGIGHCGDAGILACEGIEYEWQYHLQQMAIADDPIKYIEENK
jgi:hypothetical protein